MNGKKIEMGTYNLVSIQDMGGRKVGGRTFCTPPQQYEDEAVKKVFPEYYAGIISMLRGLCTRFGLRVEKKTSDDLGLA